MLPTNFYHETKIFDKEIEKIFLNHWIFFCLTQEFNGEGSYVHKNISGHNIFLRKNENGFVAFLNRCPHRFHPIVTGDVGHTNLVCPYHYWAFKDDGSLKGIPYEKECYQYTKQDKSCIHLKTVPLKQEGSLLFINFSKRPGPLSAQFKPHLISEIKTLSDSFSQYRKVVFRKKFNWKLIQENLRDGLHPAFLHQKTLLNAIKFAPPAIPKEVPIQLLGMRDLSYGGPDVALKGEFAFKKYFKNPWICEARYYNFHLFPSVHIAAADGGHTFIVENFIPISPNQTDIEIYFVLTSNNLTDDSADKVFDGLIKNALEVYNEDFLALEAIQSAVRGVKSYPINGSYERLITRFHKGCIKISGLGKYYWPLYLRDLLKMPLFLLKHFRAKIENKYGRT